MRPLRALAIYLLAVFLGGALLAPGLHAGAQHLAETFPAFKKIADQPFHRYLNRAFLFLALAGMWPLVRALGVRSFDDLGLRRGPHRWGNLGKGFAIGFVSLALVALICLAAGARIWDYERPAAQIPRHLFNATLAAVFVSVIEEVLFRGAIFGGLWRAFNFRAALVIASAVYALVHFFGRIQAEGPVYWHSGLTALPQLLGGFGNVQTMLPGFPNLMLAGVLLAVAFARTGSLHASIGMHAAWIFWLKTYGFFTVAKAGTSQWLWGTNKLIDGWLAFLLLALTWPIIHRAFPTQVPGDLAKRAGPATHISHEKQ